jgi:hypothetical protein
MEESLDAIEETLRMRLAEERKSQKGDVYFLDVSKTSNIDVEYIQGLRERIKNNDPEASRLLDELKRRIIGVSK